MQKLIYLLFGLILSTNLIAQELKPTEQAFLVNVTVSNFEEKALQGEQIFFDGDITKKSFSGVTSAEGTFQILLPKGETYSVRYKDFSETVDYNKIELPNQAGKYVVDVFIKYQPSKVFVLDDVHFDTGRSTLKESSYPALNDIVEIMKLKPNMKIEIGGHTDNVGDPQANMRLSVERARSVRNYLMSKGISSNRLTSEGYGETRPISDNNTEIGRQENRRTEVTILSD
jgi:outer membrane protein OmpA-like peptidoglycan-associated protein